MRLVFLFLVLLNVAFYAWASYFSAWIGAGEERVSFPPLNPEKLRILQPSDLAAFAKKPPPATSAPAPVAPPATVACLEWGSFAPAEAERAIKALEPLALSKAPAERHTEESVGWWVFIPPQGSRQKALRKAEELKSLGVADYYVVGDDTEERWALSLGVFRSEEAARARLAELRGLGVRSARLGERQAVVPKVWLQFQGADAALQARLAEIVRRTEGSELRACR